MTTHIWYVHITFVCVTYSWPHTPTAHTHTHSHTHTFTAVTYTLLSRTKPTTTTHATSYHTRYLYSLPHTLFTLTPLTTHAIYTQYLLLHTLFILITTHAIYTQYLLLRAILLQWLPHRLTHYHTRRRRRRRRRRSARSGRGFRADVQGQLSRTIPCTNSPCRPRTRHAPPRTFDEYLTVDVGRRVWHWRDERERERELSVEILAGGAIFRLTF